MCALRHGRSADCAWAARHPLLPEMPAALMAGLIEYSALAHDSGGERGIHPSGTLFEIGLPARQDVFRYPESSDCLPHGARMEYLIRRIVGHHHAEIQIAVRPRLTARSRPKKVNFHRMVRIDEAAGDLPNRSFSIGDFRSRSSMIAPTTTIQYSQRP